MTKITIWTSADGLNGITVAEYTAEVLRQVALAIDNCEIDLDVDEQTSGETRISVDTGSHDRGSRDVEADIAATVREIVNVSAFEACCA